MYFLFIILLSLASSCGQIASANTPDWVLGKGHPSFPNTKYLIGVGLSEKSPITASESARAELIKNIRVNLFPNLLLFRKQIFFLKVHR